LHAGIAPIRAPSWRPMDRKGRTRVEATIREGGFRVVRARISNPVISSGDFIR